MAKNLHPRYLTILRRIHNIPACTHQDIIYINNNPHYNTTPTITQAYSNINDKIPLGALITPNNLRLELPHLPLKIIQELTICILKKEDIIPSLPSQTTTTPHPIKKDQITPTPIP
jgi:hypothetical protein